MNTRSKTEVRELPSGGWQGVQSIEALVEPFASGGYALEAESIALRLNFLRGYTDEELTKQGSLQQALDAQYAEGKRVGYSQGIRSTDDDW